MNDRLRRLTVSVSRRIPGPQIRRGFIWGIQGWAIVPVFGVPWLIGVALVSLCHLHAWETSPSRELTSFERLARSRRWVGWVCTIIILVLFICLYPWRGLVELVRAS